MLIILIVLAVINLILCIILLVTKNNNFYQNILEEKFKNLREDFSANRKETADAEREARKENQETLMNFQNSINTKFDSLSKNTQESLDRQKESVQIGLKDILEANEKKLDEMRKTVEEKLKNTQESLDKQKESVQTGLKDILEANEKKLDEMRKIVDEKLQSTLEKRLNSSFEIVSKQLEAVQKGLGEMQTIANDVGGLKRALTSVKTAGTLGEVQLEALLSQILSPYQYEKNAHPNPSNPSGVVEFAIKLPSKEDENEFIYLPIDSKFPTSAYDKLLQDYELADKNALEADKKRLATDLRNFAKDIKNKYIEVPYTTDFAVMFLPFEGLYLEAIRIPGIIQQIQNDFNITIAGPTTLGAFLNSLQMGFRTLAIQEQTDKVWNILRGVKTEFGKFGSVLDATKKKLESAAKEIENAGVRTRAIERKLKDVESLPEQEMDFI